MRTPDSLQQLLARQAAEQATQTQQRKHQRDLGPLKAVVFLLLATGAGYVGWHFEELKARYLDKTETAADPPAGDSAAGSGFAVDTEQVHFLMPSEPRESHTQVPVLDSTLKMSIWVIEDGADSVGVTLLEAPGPANFDAVAGYDDWVNGALKTPGTAVSTQEDFVRDGEPARRVTMITPTGFLRTEMYTHGIIQVFLTVDTSVDAAPPAYTTLIDSFRFL